MKFYRKQPIEAEQFDGSEEMIDKYHIEMVEGDYAEDYSMPEAGPAPYVRYFLTRFDVAKGISAGDWIVTGINGEHWTIADDVFKKTYAELPVIPENIAYIIKQAKKGDYKLGWVFHATYLGLWRVSVGNWIRTHADTVARAWLDGYQVEEDK
ncbi:DUF1642 domain-containing protein [Lactiplantibacillus plantarum]|uniref:DUF1642 domain-containing protein n=1 Tax=Lactiplantibacillus plantarum TaxID=1590 RepID=UPI000D2073AE|nr:DUF1642 domain-containing protein [Lactiplantibacillus plantarum]AVH85784.1 Rhs family protein [Lactobacillus phage PM411]QSW67368.1 DUF1642 domain-containing protein [Lactiplantibacillus plantarum]VFI58526.1 hypothetical protein LAP9492_01265 [Lactiplantibacillus plantarum]VFI59019.1 hypothetical protein LAP9571_01265 [Lactiplantibacillus plantarum]